MFTFKGITSTSMDVLCDEEDFFARAGMRYDSQETEGFDGGIYTELGRADIALSLNLQLLDVSKLDAILAWLDGAGEFIFNGRKTRAHFYSEMKPSRMATLKQIPVTFIRASYWQLETEAVQTVTSSPATIVNSGTAIAYPLLKVTGMGPVELSLNGIGFNYVFLPGDTEVYIDCGSYDYEKSMVIQDAYVVGPVELRNRRLTLPNNKFPYLSPGNNTLNFISGSITSVEVTKRSRFL